MDTCDICNNGYGYCIVCFVNAGPLCDLCFVKVKAFEQAQVQSQVQVQALDQL
jgi:hypothetical protein